MTTHTVHARRSVSRTAADALAGAAVLATAAAVTLAGLGGVAGTPVLDNLPVDVVLSVSYSVIGAILVGQRPGNVVGALLLLSGLAGTLSVVSAVVAANATAPTAWAQAAVTVTTSVWVVALVPLLTLVPLLYPEGRLLSTRWRPVLFCACVGGVAALVGLALVGSSVTGRVAVTSPGVPWLGRVLVLVGAVLLLPTSVAAVVSLFLRLRRSEGLARRQIVVVLVAATVVLGQYAVRPSLVQGLAGQVIEAASVALLPLAIGIAVTRHRLYDLDLVVRRSLTAASLAGCLAGLYLAAFLTVDGLLPGHENAIAGIAAGLTGLAVWPLATRLATTVDRLFYGDRGQPVSVLADLSTRIRACADPAALPDIVCSAVSASLLLPAVAIELDGDGDRPALTYGTATDETRPQYSLSLEHQGRRLGSMLASPRLGQPRLDARDTELLRYLADAAAPALAAAALHGDLVLSRERLVAAREEERRHLRRDLHDGVGAALAATRLQVESARVLLADDDPAAHLLDTATGALAEAIGDVRRVTEDLRPPALDELGLAAVLGALATRLSTQALPIDTWLPEPFPTLPAAVEVAVYRIAAEALTNSARHSHATRATLRVEFDDDRLVVTASDDGTGIPRTAPPLASDAEPGAERNARCGMGLESMRDRATEIGGRLTIATGRDGRGTVVRADLPRSLA